MKINQTLKSSAILMLVAFIWGFAFVGQRTGTEFVGPLFFIGARMILAVLTLSVPLYIKWSIGRRSQSNPVKLSVKEYIMENKLLIKAGCSCGTVLFFAMLTQQIALIYTSASKAGFLTTLYIIIVPIMGRFLGKGIRLNTWVSVFIAVAGLYFLTVSDSFSIGIGDMILLGGAFFWASHIIVIDHFAPKVDVVKMSMVQFGFNCVLGFGLSPIFDHFFMPNMSMENVIAALPSLLWVGVISSGIALTLQAVGQKGANPAAAALILSLEAVFSLIGGFLLLNESLTVREFIGCILMFVAVVLAQIPVKKKLRR